MDRLFDAFDYVVAPSASCTAFVKSQHYCLTAAKIYDVCEFLHDVLQVDHVPGRFPHRVSVHNSCHGVRELHLSSASELNITPYSKIKDLLAMVEGIEVAEPERVDECCGFGGMFAVEEQAVSVCMGQDKLKNHLATGATYITGADSSCLMHLQGIARREQMPVEFIHVTQILAAGL
jgi:L-lactate dehydrogenase complex protein LldE